eukprot:11164554-Lingulodinium_polyedra.AAC.1
MPATPAPAPGTPGTASGLPALPAPKKRRIDLPKRRMEASTKLETELAALRSSAQLTCAGISAAQAEIQEGSSEQKSLYARQDTMLQQRKEAVLLWLGSWSSQQPAEAEVAKQIQEDKTALEVKQKECAEKTQSSPCPDFQSLKVFGEMASCISKIETAEDVDSIKTLIGGFQELKSCGKQLLKCANDACSGYRAAKKAHDSRVRSLAAAEVAAKAKPSQRPVLPKGPQPQQAAKVSCILKPDIRGNIMVYDSLQSFTTAAQLGEVRADRPYIVQGCDLT